MASWRPMDGGGVPMIAKLPDQPNHPSLVTLNTSLTDPKFQNGAVSSLAYSRASLAALLCA